MLQFTQDLLDQLDRLVAPATRTIRHAPTEIRLGPADGMPAECVLTLDHLQIVTKRSLRKKITSLDPARLDEVCEKISYAFGG